MNRVREALTNYINNNTQNIRAEFCIVEEENEDGTYNVQPLSGDTPINSVLTYVGALGPIKPLIGSIVTVQFYDNQICYITNIIDYDEYSIFSENETTMASQKDVNIVGSNLYLYGLEEIDLEKINELKERQSQVPGTIDIYSDNTLFINGKDIQINAQDFITVETKDFDVTTTDQITLDTSTIDTNADLINWNNVNMILLMKNMADVLDKLDLRLSYVETFVTGLGAVVPPDPTSRALINNIKQQVSQL